MEQSKGWTLLQQDREGQMFWVVKHLNCSVSTMAHHESCIACSQRIPDHLWQLRDMMNKLSGNWDELRDSPRD